MISDASQPSVSRLVAERAMWLCIATDKAFENVFCIKAILRLPTKNRFYESTQRLIQPRPVRCELQMEILLFPQFGLYTLCRVSAE
jgi:hypothetical protein